MITFLACIVFLIAGTGPIFSALGGALFGICLIIMAVVAGIVFAAAMLILFLNKAKKYKPLPVK